MHSPETHYSFGTGGYKIIVSQETLLSLETHLWNVKPPSVCVRVVLLCGNAKCVFMATRFKSIKVTVVMDI